MNIISRLISLPRFTKKLLLMFADTILLVLALWFSFSLRLGELFIIDISDRLIWLSAAAPIIAIPLFIRFGLYRAIIRYLGMRAAWPVVQAVALYAVLWGLLALLSGVPGIPRSVVLINAMVALLVVGGSRMLMRWLLRQTQEGNGAQSDRMCIRLVIFGAGEAGRQLAVGLVQSPDYKLCGFVDDAAELQGRDLMGVPILSIEQLEPFVERQKVTELLLAIPSITRKARNQIIERLRPVPVRIRTLPGIVDLAKGKVNLSELHELDVEDLLARDPAEPDESLLQAQVNDQVVMVTGAGGSIGSEICRQILRRRPKVLLLFEMSEFALYEVDQKLSGLVHNLVSESESESERRGVSLVPKVIPLLGSVQDERRLTEILQTWKVNTIYHAAAFKHVPMIERSMSEAVKNNILGTVTLVKSAMVQGVKNLVFISTDKAVRPTNTMGASKRVAEMVLQALVAEKTPVFDELGSDLPPMEVTRKTALSMVRFGNVLGSSGSVVPLFRRQIRNGGPITLTHQDIIRYFMTIPEAAQLVMQAGAMSGEAEAAEAAEVFVLDMGEPVKIYDLASRMVELSGFRVRDEAHPEGDIEIKITGLRPGEKLYEELLIGDNPMPTQHPRIMKAHEEFVPWSELQPQLHSLQIAAENSDIEMIRGLLQRLVKGYQPESQIADWVYREQMHKE
ncbi:MAG: polysaccharide biosynthesis protein [Gammaproteobacteria bacterium]|nr:polysaccharide biosynthesis protein [Gammaproteobacteria bacterium]MBT4548393.1 polysaccharide biosynthesis protein [Gammaproteobacteria bacterium]